jgi:hypothetical protein
VIRDSELYAGVRLTVPARVDRARTVLRADVNVATVLAEKLVTMIDRAEATTRERDFADVVLLTRRHPVSAVELLAALQATATHRQSTLHPLAGLSGRLGDARQSSWTAYLARSGLAGLLPAGYAEAITEVARFADPVLTGAVASAAWDPVKKTWTRAAPSDAGCG